MYCAIEELFTMAREYGVESDLRRYLHEVLGKRPDDEVNWAEDRGEHDHIVTSMLTELARLMYHRPTNCRWPYTVSADNFQEFLCLRTAHPDMTAAQLAEMYPSVLTAENAGHIHRNFRDYYESYQRLQRRPCTSRYQCQGCIAVSARLRAPPRTRYPSPGFEEDSDDDNPLTAPLPPSETCRQCGDEHFDFAFVTIQGCDHKLCHACGKKTWKRVGECELCYTIVGNNAKPNDRLRQLDNKKRACPDCYDFECKRNAKKRRASDAADREPKKSKPATGGVVVHPDVAKKGRCASCKQRVDEAGEDYCNRCQNSYAY